MIYQVGDIVRLKTNNQKMVVESICGKTGGGFFKADVFCVYYDSIERKIHAKYYNPNLLDYICHSDHDIVPELGKEVILKSGGTKCVIDEIDGDNVSCIYDNGRIDQHNYKIWDNAENPQNRVGKSLIIKF